ncbi:MAG: MarR family transcriptional regulator [Candidatus Falkowbacteria bacterium]
MKINREQMLHTLIEKLHHALKEMHAGQSFNFGEYILSRPQVVILFCIAEKESGVSVKELTMLMQVTPGAVTQFIDSLVEKKLVIREVDEADRRSIIIKLTPRAKKQFKNFKCSYFSTVGQVFEDFSLADLEQFGLLLEKIKSPALKNKHI